jgi:hypothetical protein
MKMFETLSTLSIKDGKEEAHPKIVDIKSPEILLS